MCKAVSAAELGNGEVRFGSAAVIVPQNAWVAGIGQKQPLGFRTRGSAYGSGGVICPVPTARTRIRLKQPGSQPRLQAA